jgi:hypothetical protein
LITGVLEVMFMGQTALKSLTIFMIMPFLRARMFKQLPSLAATLLRVSKPLRLAEAKGPPAPTERQILRCDHSNIKRYGNMHGRFAQCLECLVRFKWVNEEWVRHSQRSAGSSSSSALPLPTAADTLRMPSSTPSAATAKSKAQAFRGSLLKPSAATPSASRAQPTPSNRRARRPLEMSGDQVMEAEQYYLAEEEESEEGWSEVDPVSEDP